ncbi:hypothetical protein J3Q64DRAFT_1830089 [Phycomyces blakesleeanus]|uniref:Uncharacterized protein n=1 Tax=Phycomyces blakesleeanus TaxID=4837 RepID=A0ABR3B983_PHYBL
MHTFKFVKVAISVTDVSSLPNQNQDIASNVKDSEPICLGKLEGNEAPESDNDKESNLGPESTPATAYLVNKFKQHDQFKDLNDDYFKNTIDGDKCGKNFKDLTKTYKLRADCNRRKTGCARSHEAPAWAFFDQMKEILINDPSVYPQNFGQSRTSRPTSMTTTSSNRPIVHENTFGDSRTEIEVLLKAVVSNNTNDNHASDLNSVISNNENEKSLTAA